MHYTTRLSRLHRNRLKNKDAAPRRRTPSVARRRMAGALASLQRAGYIHHRPTGYIVTAKGLHLFEQANGWPLAVLSRTETAVLRHLLKPMRQP